MGFKITKDKISRSSDDQLNGKLEGETFYNYRGGNHKFRLLDDDGEVYFYGLSDSDNDEQAFEPLDFFGTTWGCVDIQYKVNGRYESL